MSAEDCDPPCIGCKGDHTGEDIDVNDDCPRHGYHESDEPDLGRPTPEPSFGGAA